jgi:DNA modification methylase
MVVELMANITWTNTTVRLGDLKPWQDNPRTSSKAQAKRILASFEKYGQVAPIAVGPNFEVYDGHQRLSALLTIHGPNFEVEARQSSKALTDDERRGLVLALANATGSWNWDSLSGWNTETLTEWGFDKDTLKGWKSDVTALGEFLKSEAPVVDAEPQTDRAEALLEKWQVSSNQLWEIPSNTAQGSHFLLCGDCTDKAVIEAVMQGKKTNYLFTDPPYGIDYDPQFLAEIAERHNKRLSSADKVTNDDGSLDLSFLFEYKHRMIWGFPYIYDKDATGWIVWDKQPGVESRGIVTPIEMASTTMRKGFDMVRVMWGGFYRAAGEDKQPHPTQKPLGVYSPFIERWTNAGDIIFDPFSGSAPVMTVCEKLGRLARSIELEPKYVAVSLERLSVMGLQPILSDLGIRREIV